MYISKKILELLRDVKGFLGQGNRDVYCTIKQEIKYNPKYQSIRFMSEKKFYQCLEIGKDLDEHEIYDSKGNNILELYYLVTMLKGKFKFECYEKWYSEVMTEEFVSINKSSYLLKLFVRHQKNRESK